MEKDAVIIDCHHMTIVCTSPNFEKKLTIQSIAPFVLSIVWMKNVIFIKVSSNSSLMTIACHPMTIDCLRPNCEKKNMFLILLYCPTILVVTFVLWVQMRRRLKHWKYNAHRYLLSCLNYNHVSNVAMFVLTCMIG